METSTDPVPKLLTTQEVADRWKVDRSYVYRLCQSRRIPFSRLGSNIRIREDHADAWLASNTVPAAPDVAV